MTPAWLSGWYSLSGLSSPLSLSVGLAGISSYLKSKAAVPLNELVLCKFLESQGFKRPASLSKFH